MKKIGPLIIIVGVITALLWVLLQNNLREYFKEKNQLLIGFENEIEILETEFEFISYWDGLVFDESDYDFLSREDALKLEVEEFRDEYQKIANYEFPNQLEKLQSIKEELNVLENTVDELDRKYILELQKRIYRLEIDHRDFHIEWQKGQNSDLLELIEEFLEKK